MYISPQKQRYQISSVQSLSRVQLLATPWITAHQASLCITNSWSSLKLLSRSGPVQSVVPSSHLILCLPLLLLPSIPPSIRVFSNESTLHMWWPKYWSFSFSISPSNEHPGLISSRMDWLDLLAVQENLKSLLQHHSSKASIFQHSVSSQPNSHIHTWPLEKRWTGWTFVGKVMSLHFNMLSRLVITFLPRSKRLLISWLQSPSAVILEPPKIKSATVSTVSPSICHEVTGPDAMILVLWMLSFKPTFSLSSFTFIKSVVYFTTKTKMPDQQKLKLLSTMCGPNWASWRGGEGKGGGCNQKPFQNSAVTLKLLKTLHPAISLPSMWPEIFLWSFL